MKPDLTASPHYEVCHSEPTSPVDRPYPSRNYLQQRDSHQNVNKILKVAESDNLPKKNYLKYCLQLT